MILHSVPNGWTKQAYLKVFYFEMEDQKDITKFFKRMENSEQVYKEMTPSKKIKWADVNHSGHSRNTTRGESAQPTYTAKVRTNKCKKNHAYHYIDKFFVTKTFMFHGPQHSTK